MNNDNFPEIPKKPEKKFTVHIDDSDYLSPSQLDEITPPPVTKKKFEVHIDEYDSSSTDSSATEHQPQYKGEIYFSNRKPVKKENEIIEDVVSSSENLTPKTQKTTPKKKKKNINIFIKFIWN